MWDYSKKRTQKAFECIDGLFEFSVKIYTPVYQSFRRIKKIGTAHYLFMTASNSRFEVYLGTGMSPKYKSNTSKTLSLS